jgi:hypothetical protein
MDRKAGGIEILSNFYRPAVRSIALLQETAGLPFQIGLLYTIKPICIREWLPRLVRFHNAPPLSVVRIVRCDQFALTPQTDRSNMCPIFNLSL